MNRNLVCMLLLAGLNLPAVAQQKSWDDLRSLPFPENYPTQDSADRLHDELLFQRACQVVIRSLPATALWAMKKGSEAEFGEGSNVFPIWKDRLSAETIVKGKPFEPDARMKKILETGALALAAAATTPSALTSTHPQQS